MQLLEHLAQDRGVVGDHLGDDRAAGRLLGLVREPGDAAVVADLDDPVVGRVVALRRLDDHDRALRVALAVGVEDVLVVEPVDVVGAHDQDDVGLEGGQLVAEPEQLVGVPPGEALLVHPAGALVGQQDPQPAEVAVEVPRPAVGHLLLERRALELQREPDVADAGVGEVGQREVDQLVHACERQRGLRALAGQHVHAAADAAGLDQREHARSGHPRVTRAGSCRAHSTGRPSPRAISIRCTSEVPSPISSTLASR